MLGLSSWFILAASAITFVAAQQFQPKPEIRIDLVDIILQSGNSYFKDWTSKIESDGQVISVKMPVVQDLPDSAMMAVKVELSGQEVLNFKSTICEALEDESFGKKILEYAEPKGKFPEECPFVMGEDFEISKYKVPNDALPPNTQPGEFRAEIKLYTASEDEPEALLTATGEIIMK